jgi:hypothetical protein
MTTKERGVYTSILQGFQREIDSYKSNLKVVRTSSRIIKVAKTRAKTREVKKVMKAQKSVCMVKYMKSSSELQVVSVDPAIIVGASHVVLYNTKKRQATLLIAENSVDGLTVKGTTIGGFSAKSILKPIRKGSEQKAIPELRKSKARVETMFATNLPGKTYTGDDVSGRLNEFTLILAAWK